MNINETEICKLKDEEEFSWKKDLIIPLFVTSVIGCIFYKLPNIVGSLNFINPSWKDGLEEIIKQAFSPKYVLVSVLFIILLIIIFILSSIIWPFFRRCKTRLKRIKLLEKELDKSRSDYKYLEFLSRLQSQKRSTSIYITFAPDKPSDSKKSMYFKPTPDKPSSPETKNYTGHTTPIDSGKIEIPDIANDTANPHNEDQE
jgi:hypothetical protein